MKDGETPLPARKRPIIVAASIILVINAAYFIYHLRHKKSSVDPAFSKYIESYTTGIISKENTIRIRLASQVTTTHVQNDQLADGVFDFTPAIKGKAYWVDERTIEFRPEAKLVSDQSYSADFKLSKVTEVLSKFENFMFFFQTVKPDFTVSFSGLETATNTSIDKMKLSGCVQTADAEDATSIEKLISTSFESPVKVVWQLNSVTRMH